MEFIQKLFAIFVLVVFVSIIQTYSMPVEESLPAFELADHDEMMAEDLQNPEVQYYAVSKLRTKRQAGRQRPRNEGRNPANHWPYKGYFN